ncbi:hypothetical protein NDU88_001539 [Pleurodeles waltl]|uniref:Uncharacterized protein n=1 Tax=Pleurodeles waltl TaxID=8319 RepID=A0AAV7NB12_PLEWA|nr:hypothetical protein NDU88_001539 [Pleurodeles waltl]
MRFENARYRANPTLTGALVEAQRGSLGHRRPHTDDVAKSSCVDKMHAARAPCWKRARHGVGGVKVGRDTIIANV